MKWISVEDELPTEVDGFVLTYYSNGNIAVTWWSDVPRSNFGITKTHWMPLPEPPTHEDKS